MKKISSICFCLCLYLCLSLSVAEAAKHISCLDLPSGYSCTASMKSISSGAGTAEFTDQAMSEIADAGSSARTSYVYNWSGTLDSAKDYLVYCRCTKTSNPTLAWAYWFDLTETRMDATVSSRSTYAGGAVASVTAAVNINSNSDMTAIKAKTDNLPTDPADDSDIDAQLAALQADLDNPSQYKADVSGLATQASVDAITESYTLDIIYDFLNEDINTNVQSILQDTAALDARLDDTLVTHLNLIPTNPLLTGDSRLPESAIAQEINIETHVTNALNSYDPPTKGELDSAVSPLALDLTVAKQASLDNATYGLSALQVLLDAIATSTEITAMFDEIKGSGWTTETLKAIKEAIGSGGISQQQVRDAMKLAPTAGDPETGSVDKKLDDIQTETNTHPTLSEIEASTALAKEATVATIPTNPLQTNDVRLPSTIIAAKADIPTGSGATLEEIEGSAVLAKEATLNTISANLLRGLGLVMENHVEDDIQRNIRGLKTSSKFYLYDNKTHATTHDKLTGLIATYTVAVTYNSKGEVTLFKVVKD